MEIGPIGCHRLPFIMIPSIKYTSRHHNLSIDCVVTLIYAWSVTEWSEFWLSTGININMQDFQPFVIQAEAVTGEFLLSSNVTLYQWSHISIIVTEITGNFTVCWTASSGIVLKTSKLCIIGLFVSRISGWLGFPSQRASNVEHTFMSWFLMSMNTSESRWFQLNVILQCTVMQNSLAWV